MIASLALAVILALAQEPPKPEAPPVNRPASDVKLSATLDKASYALGDEMQIEARLENTSDKDIEINEPTYEEGSMTFHVSVEWADDKKKQEYDLAVVRPDPHVKTRLSPLRVALGAKKSLTLVRRFPTLAAGTFTFTARYSSLNGVVEAAPVTAKVEAPSAGNKLFATVTTAQHGKFSFELKPKDAPANVSNFVELVRRDFYNDMIVHRIIKKNWIQTGCPYGLGIGGPGYAVKAETPQEVAFEEGTVAMSGYEKSGYHGSQFFITLAPLPALDKKFTIIGKVPADQLEPVRAIGNVEVDKNTDRPRNDVRITGITIELKN
ncbi:MAG: peptidylprolyl isomerase [Planctomycetes bacterium]|nr:peptidylprolyl isomerase [Planctomycetota bacterium]